jgi:histidinol-phosphate aminotransferase
MKKTADSILPPRPAVVELSAYDPQHFETRINLSANENSFGLPPALRRRLEELVEEMAFSRYPDPTVGELRQVIAERHGVDPERVVVGNGGDELIQALLLAYGGPERTAVAFTPTFSMYEILAKVTGTRFVGLDRDRAFDIPADAARRVNEAGGRIVFACSPNNPTGNVVDAGTIRSLCKEVDGLVMIDEAYQEFSSSTALDLPQYRNLAVLRTFSKAFSLAGLRVGYLIADPEIIRNINKVRLPYNVNVFSQAAAAALMSEPGELEEIIAEITVERGRLAEAISDLGGYNVYPSGANFLLVECAESGDAVWRKLLDEGILVRNFSGVPRLENCLRITVGTGLQNNAVIDALKRIGGTWLE